MMIIGVDYHPNFQPIAFFLFSFFLEETGETFSSVPERNLPVFRDKSGVSRIRREFRSLAHSRVSCRFGFPVLSKSARRECREHVCPS
jgi:hypothetical protein